MPVHTAKRSTRSNFIQKSPSFVQEHFWYLEVESIITTFAATKKQNDMMNEETISQNNPQIEGRKEVNKEENPWKLVTLGGVTGVLMGAGLLYGGQMAAKELDPVESPETVAPEAGETSHTLENGLKVAAVNDDLSFGEAFAQARAEVGPGGVFHWHGGIYNTYTAAEWNNMSVGEKHDFAQQVQPEVRPDEVPTPTDANSHVIVEHHVYHHHEGSPATQTEELHQAAADASDDVQMVEQQLAKNFDMGDDVHIVGYANSDGHLAVGYDTTGDGQADVAIIDVDNNFRPSDEDVIVDKDGYMARIGDLNNESDPYVQTDQEEPNASGDTFEDPMMIDA